MDLPKPTGAGHHRKGAVGTVTRKWTPGHKFEQIVQHLRIEPWRELPSLWPFPQHHEPFAFNLTLVILVHNFTFFNSKVSQNRLK
jgi:hypothetical protein